MQLICHFIGYPQGPTPAVPDSQKNKYIIIGYALIGRLDRVACGPFGQGVLMNLLKNYVKIPTVRQNFLEIRLIG
jgi:hypothetical protein